MAFEVCVARLCPPYRSLSVAPLRPPTTIPLYRHRAPEAGPVLFPTPFVDDPLTKVVTHVLYTTQHTHPLCRPSAWFFRT